MDAPQHSEIFEMTSLFPSSLSPFRMIHMPIIARAITDEIIQSIRAGWTREVEIIGRGGGGTTTTTQNMSRLAKALSDPKCRLNRICITYNSLTDECLRVFVSELPSRPCSLVDLDFQGNGITDSGAMILSKGNLQHQHLKHLNLSHNYIGDTGAHFLSSIVKNLIHFDISNNQIGPGAQWLIGPQKLYIGWNNIGDEDLKEMMTKGGGGEGGEESNLEELDLEGNKLRDPGAFVLVDVISKNSKLSKLNVSWNDIGFSGIHSLANTRMILKSYELTTEGNRLEVEEETIITRMLFGSRLGDAFPHSRPSDLHSLHGR